MESIAIQFSHPRALKTYYFFLKINIFQPTMLKVRAQGFIFYFWFRRPQKVFCILSSSHIISVGTFDINDFNFTFKCKTALLISAATQDRERGKNLNPCPMIPFY